MSCPIDIQLLGDVRIVAGGAAVPLHGKRQRRMLAALALGVPRAVSIDRLVEVVWPADCGVPVTARRQVQDLISRLRKDLTAAGCDRSVLAAYGAGYALRTPVSAIDAFRFRAAVAAGRAIGDSDPERTAITFRSALRQWRGDPFAGLDCPALEAARVGLTELRLLTWEQAIEIELSLCRHDELMSELATLVELFPERERLVQLHMRALYQGGRTADALGAFHRLRHRLMAGLGVDPGPELRRCYESILRQDLQATRT